MMKYRSRILLLIFFVSFSRIFAQTDESSLKIFGYFQNSFQEWTTFQDLQKHNTFSLQQLNFFFQKDLTSNWTAFVNMEFLNNFSSIRQWGAANLEEAWVRYRSNMKFNLKLGLQIPIFNNLNEIKNRTPLLPYIIRPLVYETSFSEFIQTEQFVPGRAFVQVYGFLPSGETKFDYAVYLGNSSNVNEDRLRGQTGIDTTASFLIGGRFGIRHHELKLGFSATYEKENDFTVFAESLGRKPSDLLGLPLIRLGGDLSHNFANFSIESEFITVNVDEGIPGFNLNLGFYYATLGYNFTEQLFIYGSYWDMDFHITHLAGEDEYKEDENIRTINFGVSYDLRERIRLKAQISRVNYTEELISISPDELRTEKDNFSVYSMAVSIFF